ncbi:MAG TPA: FAD-dependent monooxygenase [Caulobacteraceae bacterium]|nr:FAD-dependent monooxygenase [Caulobacteraceae bacterium]
MTRTVIVGGGLAGGYAAALLARAGAQVTVLERSTGPADKVCGEFLSHEAQGYLRAAGLDLDALGAPPIDRVRVANGKRLAEARLPFTALGLSRRRLDEALLQHAERLGAEVRRGVSVKHVGAEGLETSDGALAADRTILASGKHDVRGAGRESDNADWGMVGFKLYFTLEPAQRRALEGAVEIVMFDGGYAGLQLVEDGRANLCLLVREAHFASVGRTWDELSARLMSEPHLARRFGGAQASEPRPLAIARLPFGFLRRQSVGERVYPVGDQAAVIPSFTGDGMAIALHSARLAAQAAADGAGADRYLARLSADLARPVGLACWLQRRAERWPGRAATVAAFAAFPPLLAHIARATRVPGRALARAA